MPDACNAGPTPETLSAPRGIIPRARIPILMYHAVSEDPQRSAPAPMYTRASVFARQVDYLRSHGYRTLGLIQAWEELQRGHDPGRAVVITFDDGYEDFYTTALPVLQKSGFTATVFVIPSYVGRARGGPNPHSYMTWSQIREVQSEGFTIGSHSLTHPVLQMLTKEQIGRELHASKEVLEEVLGTEVHSFAYPYAYPEEAREYTAYVTARLQSCGYRAAVSTIIGRAHARSHPFLLPRLPVSSRDGCRFFSAKLHGLYDWARFAQSIRKQLRGEPYPQWQTSLRMESEA